MKLQFLIILLFSYTTLLAEDNGIAVSDTLYVSADNGVTVGKQPDINAEAMTSNTCDHIFNSKGSTTKC